jgi:hypothetical protein
MLYIASSLQNSTDVDYTQNFATSKALAGAIVHVIFFTSPDAKQDQAKRTKWCPYLKSAGAKAVIFSLPGTPLQNMFSDDLTAAPEC